MNPARTIADLCFAAQNAPGHFRAMVSDPAGVPWRGMGPDDFKPVFRNILSHIDDPVLLDSFNLSLLAQYLLDSSKPAWVKDFLAENIHPEAFLNFNFNDLLQGDWVKVPLLVSGGGTARVSWFISGLIPGKTGPVYIPEWAGQTMDTAFIETARAAERLVRRTGTDPENERFVLFPVALANGNIQFKGTSGALSIGIGLQSLLKRLPVSMDLIATGCLNDSGDVLPVGMLEQKIEAAMGCRFKCLLFPADSRLMAGHDAKGLVPVSGFAESWTVACLYSGRQDNLLFIFPRALQDAASFIDKMDSLPADWIIHERAAVQALLGRIFNHPDLFIRFVRKFALMVEEFQIERAAVLARFSPKRLPPSMPMASLIWCTANLGLSNHSGKIRQAGEWEDKGKGFLDQVIKLDINLAANFLNHALVAAHNRYEFSPQAPEPLARLLEFMESRYAIQQGFGCQTDLSLGRIYGTLVQNAAFCGPDVILETEQLSLKARQALGEPLSPELKAQWVRQYDYLGTARLNAGDMAGAAACLETCLGVRNLDGIQDKMDGLTPWQISMLCRFLAKSNLPDGERWHHLLVSLAVEQFDARHPWQLIFFNLGRAAIKMKPNTARELLEKSLGICLEPSLGPAVEIMALKPLAFLEPLVPAQEFLSGLSQWEEQIRQAASRLNPAHFSFLSDRPFPKALAYVRENHDRVFPFTYG